MKKTKVYMFVDALGWKIAQAHNFMSDTFAFRYKVKMQFGYSSTAIPTILSGEPPKTHGHLCFFYFDPKNSPFKKFKYLKYLFGAGLHPKCLFNRYKVRRLIGKLFAKMHKYSGYFNMYKVPYESLPYFDYCEKRDIFAPNGIDNCKNLRDILDESGKKFHISDWRKSESYNIEAAKKAIENGSEFLFIYTADFDGFLHENPENFNKIDAKLAQYRQKIEEILAVLKENGNDFEFTLISDHGMTPCTGVVDLMKIVKNLGLKFGRDYAAFYDSTMARFWYMNDCAKTKIKSALSNPICRGSFISKEMMKQYGIDFDDNRFGEDIFLLDDGIQIQPCDLSDKSLKGMHGYSPESEDSYACMLSNRKPSFTPECVADFFRLMKADIDQK